MAGAPPRDYLIGASGVSHSYGELSVVKDLTIHISLEEVTALIAPSGAGKTTLLRLLLGLENPTDGQISRRVRNKDVGVVFQEDNLFPWYSVEKNMRIMNDLVDRRVQPERFSEILEWLELGGFAHYYPDELSAGMKQRVALGRLLLLEPLLYVIDEGMAHIDDISRFKLCDAFKERVLERRASLLLITHSLTDALHTADRILVGSGRPLTIVQEYINPLPRPRGLGIRFTSAFRMALEELRRCAGIQP